MLSNNIQTARSIEEQLSKQLQDAEPNAASEDYIIDEDDTEESTETEEALETEEPVDDVISNEISILTASTALRIAMQSRLVVNFIAADTTGLPATIRSGGNFYSTRSPLRKSKTGGQGGSKNDANGVLRQPITDLIGYMAEVNAQNTVLFGNTSDLRDNIGAMHTYMSSTANDIIYSTLGGEKTVKIRRKVRSDTDADIESGSDDNIQIDSVSLDNAFVFDSWMSYMREGNDMLLCPVFNLTIRVPLLVDTDARYDAVTRMAKFVTRAAKNSGLSSDSITVIYSMSSREVMEPYFAQFISDIQEETEVEVKLLHRGDIDESNTLLDGIYPTECSGEEAAEMLLPFGNDLAFIMSTND